MRMGDPPASDNCAASTVDHQHTRTARYCNLRATGAAPVLATNEKLASHACRKSQNTVHVREVSWPAKSFHVTAVQRQTSLHVSPSTCTGPATGVHVAIAAQVYVSLTLCDRPACFQHEPASTAPHVLTRSRRLRSQRLRCQARQCQHCDACSALPMSYRPGSSSAMCVRAASQQRGSASVRLLQLSGAVATPVAARTSVYVHRRQQQRCARCAPLQSGSAAVWSPGRPSKHPDHCLAAAKRQVLAGSCALRHSRASCACGRFR